MSSPTTRSPASLLPSTILALAVTTVLFAPHLLFNPEQEHVLPGAATALWWVVLAAAPATAAALANRRKPAATTIGRALAVGVPQWPLVVGLVLLDVWVDVRSGYLLAGSGEEAMSFGIGFVVAPVLGFMIAFIVTLAALVGARSAPDQHTA